MINLVFRTLLMIFRTLLMACAASLFLYFAYVVFLSKEDESFETRCKFAMVAASPGAVILYVEYVTWRHFLTSRNSVESTCQSSVVTDEVKHQ